MSKVIDDAAFAASFWNRVGITEDPDECWLWKTNTTGFHAGTWDGRQGRRKSTTAHRIAYELVYGPIPEGMLACHRCDNPPCCNPLHIFAGSHKDNAQDMARKGRARPLPGYRGRGNSKPHLVIKNFPPEQLGMDPGTYTAHVLTDKNTIVVDGLVAGSA